MMTSFSGSVSRENISALSIISHKRGRKNGTVWKKKLMGNMYNETRGILQALYSSFNSQLATLLNDSKYMWEY